MAGPESAQKYWAFLSYSHADSVAAAKLHRALEHYTLPRQVRRAHNLPKRLIPVFRDTEELEAAAGLTGRLQAALDQSRWLIVLCSRASAASRYVNDEIEYFLKRHGAERILCVLLDAAPPECFPPAIRALHDEPLAADLRSAADFDVAVLRLIAAMAVIGFTELRNREAQRRRRFQIAAAAVVAALGIGATLAWDFFYCEHVDYYAGFVRRNGIWEGLDAASPAAAVRHEYIYRFMRHGRLHPPERVDYLTGCGSESKRGFTDILGIRAEPDDGSSHVFCGATFRYHSDGTLAQETLVNHHGCPIETLTYTEPDLAQFTEQGFAAATARSGIYYVQFERDDRGFDRKVLFLQARGVPRSNDAHAFGYQYERDAAGHVLQESALDDHGTAGGEVVRHVYDANGVELETRYVDAQGRPRNGTDGYALVRNEVDADGNTLSRKLFLADGSPGTDADGVHERRSRWDDRGNEIEVRYYDATGEPSLDVSGVNGARQRFDDNGVHTRVEFVGKDGGIAESNEGVAVYEFVNDRWGDNVENRAFDAEGKPAVWDNGVSISRHTFDDRGNLTEEAFFGTDGKPVTTTWGAMHRDQYDARGNITEFSFFDAEGKLYVRPDNKGAVIRLKRDQQGNITESSYYGADGKPTLNRWGWAKSRSQYDEQGNMVRREYFDKDGGLVMTTEGYASNQNQYDRLGALTMRRYFDTAGRPVRLDNGSSGFSLKHDRRGWMSEKTYLDGAGKPLDVRGGFATVRYRNTDVGRTLEETYFDARGRVPIAPNAARTIFEYDAHNRELLRRCVDAKGKLANGPHDYATLKTERDRYGRVLSERATDVNGKPVNILEQRWATHLVSYDGGKKEQYLDAHGKPVQPRMYRQ